MEHQRKAKDDFIPEVIISKNSPVELATAYQALAEVMEKAREKIRQEYPLPQLTLRDIEDGRLPNPTPKYQPIEE